MSSRAVGESPESLGIWIGYALALVLPVLAYGLRLGLDDLLIGYQYATFYPAVLVVAVKASRGACVLVVLLSAILAGPFAIDSGGSFRPQSLSAAIGLCLFLSVGLLICWLMHRLRRVLADLTATRAELAAANATLEARVAERTQDLRAANEALRAETAAREAAEAQARQAQKMEAIGQLSGGIAHDFNNMLAIVTGSVSLARRKIERGEGDVLRFLDAALQGADRAAALTRRLLAFSRKQPLEPVVADVNALVRGMDDLLRRSLGERVRLELAMGGGLWRTRIDTAQLENALINLAINARDAMPEGGRLTIETMNAYLDDAYASAHAEVVAGQYVLVAVSDTGEGMTPEVMARAFDPFFTTKAAGSGTGLGLSQVYGFVKQSGGHIKIYSEPGQGTTVKLYLARHYGEGETPQAAPEAEGLPVGDGSVTVLVVEDDAGVRAMTAAALRELGYGVVEAATAEEALPVLHARRDIALMLTDVVMPGLSGRQLAEAALAFRPDLRVIYTTGYTANAIVHNGIVDPGVELLTKPFGLEQLARKVARVLRG